MDNSNISSSAGDVTSSETTSDTAPIISNEIPSTSTYTQLNKTSNFLEDSDEHGSHGVRRRHTVGKIKPGSMNVLSAKYESLDYDTCENHLLLDEERKRGYPYIVWKDMARWFIILLIGAITALIACVIDICIEEFSDIKYKELKKSVDKYVLIDSLYIPYLLWVLSNVCVVFIGSVLVAYVEPVAAGSGIPQVKCYLNGVKVPRVVRFKTLVVKAIGVITAVVGGLAGGKEGPMIHSGAVVAAGISQGKSTTFNKDFKIFQYFRDDHEKRDFVSAGAAAGVSAAFGAPIGGVLFSLEEGASFWNQALTWRTFFGTVVSTFTLNVVLSAYHGHWWDLSYPGLLHLGKMDPFPVEFYELPLFVLFGAIGGLLGALWNYINYRLAVFRIRYISLPWLRVVEACLVAAASATCGFLMMFLVDDCRPLGEDPTKVPLQLFCADGEYSGMAAIWFQTPEASVKSFLHDPIGSYKPTSILIFVVCYFLLSTWTFGLAVSSGLFIPNLLTGAAWGRLLALMMQMMVPSMEISPAKYALIGAAAQLGGVVRMTISLTVIIIETTGQISNALPIIITLVVAKWVGDFFNEGIYDIYIQLAAVPLLPWEPPPLTHNIYASEVMSHPVFTLRTVENVGHIVELLKLVSYNGFPVVDPPLIDDVSLLYFFIPPPLLHNIYASEVMSHPVFTLRTVENVGHIVELLKLVSYNGFPVVDPPLIDDVSLLYFFIPPPLLHNIYASEVMSHPVFTLRTVENVGHIVELLKLVSYNGFPVVDPPLIDDTEIPTYKRLRGLILRSQLIVLIQNKLYNENANTTWSNVDVDMNIFRNEYPRFPSIEELEISDWEKTCTIDLRPYMNPSPYTLPHRASLPRMFRLCRALGLRHLPIVNDVNEVVGMVTRKDIARYRVWRHRGHMGMEELVLSSEI